MSKCPSKPRKKKALIRRDGLYCSICRQLMTLRSITIDHFIPISKGGTHKLENLRLAHRWCNQQKGSKVQL